MRGGRLPRSLASKRGLSHLEMVMSFVIFIAVAGFALYFFSPLKYDKLVDTSFEYAFREIVKNTSVSAEIFSVKIENATILAAVQRGEMTLTDPIAVNISGLSKNLNVTARDNLGRVLIARREVDSEFVHLTPPGNDGWKDINLANLIFTDEPEKGRGGLGVHDESFYRMASSNFEELISENLVLMLNYSYHKDYASVKEQFNLPSRINFGFDVEFNDGSVVDANRVPQSGTETFAETRRVKILLKNGEIVFADLSVKVW